MGRDKYPIMWKDYGLTDEDVSNEAVQFFGWLNQKGAWYIRRRVNDGGIISHRYVFGNGDYEAAWESRDSLRYEHVTEH